RYVTGTFNVPCYLITDKCAIGGGFHYSSNNPDALPSQKPGNIATPRFYCTIPTAANTRPGRASLFGHGLLLAGTPVTSPAYEALASEQDIVMCATDWWGQTTAPYANDLAYDVSTFKDLNRGPPVVDRVQQGVLNTLYLGRLMIHPQGFAS